VYTDLAKWAKARGHTHLRVDGAFVAVDPWPRLDRFKEHTLELPVGDLVLAGPCALVVVTAAARDLSGVTGRLTAPRTIRWGERSFALYLVHMLIILAAAPLYADAGFWQGLLVAAALSGVALAAAALLHRTVEQPWERRLRPPRRATGTRPVTEHVEGARPVAD